MTQRDGQTPIIHPIEEAKQWYFNRDWYRITYHILLLLLFYKYLVINLITESNQKTFTKVKLRKPTENLQLYFRNSKINLGEIQL